MNICDGFHNGVIIGKSLKFEGPAHIISWVVLMHMNKERTSPWNI